MKKCILSIVAICVVVRGLAAQSVPSPLSTPVDVIISGRTSTSVSVAIENVGQNIPLTFSGDRLRNAAGFTWYVSRHYALQTDYSEERARHLVTLLELAYPHYVALFGRQIPEIDQRRMAVIYGSTVDSLKRVMNTDGINWDFGGGGITYEGINAAFNYPSGTLQYHQRYILLHECAHLYQDCLNGATSHTPPWFVEGVADSVAHHVWEESAQRLTMSVVDKPTINNWYDAGLEIYGREPFTAGDILSGRRGGRELYFLLVSYFTTDLDRLMRFRIWRDELFRLRQYNGYQSDSARLIQDLFDAEQLDADFDAWLKARRSSFHYVDWGWEQDGDAMISYGWPQSGPFSQTDLLRFPSELSLYDPLVMDYPCHPRSPLVGQVKRGVAEPTIGCVVDFQLNPDRGAAGMALGVEGRSCVKILVEQRKRLVIDGIDLDAGQCSTEFSDAFRDCNSLQIGLTIRIGQKALEVTARAETQSAILSLSLSESQRQRLLSRPMAVLARDGRHQVTPYIDDARKPEPDLKLAAPANRWRFSMDSELYPLYRANWRLGKLAPLSLVVLREELRASADKDASMQAALKETFSAELAKVTDDITNCSARPDAIQAALAECRPR